MTTMWMTQPTRGLNGEAAPPEGGRGLTSLVEALRSYAIYELNADGVILGCNAGVKAIQGFSAGDIVGRHISSFYSASDISRGADRALVANALDKGVESSTGALTRKDGTRFRASVVLEKVVNADEEVRLVMVVRDVTDTFEAQKRVQEAQEITLRAQRLDAVGKLTLGLAHDFNNLLTVIVNSLDMLAARRSGDESARKILDIAHRAVDRGSLLTRQMLAFGRGQTLVPEQHSTNDLINRSLDLYRRVCGETIQLQVALAEALPQVSVDAGQFEAAVLNLLGNSRDAMRGAGRVVLRTQLARLQLPGLSGGEAADYVCVTVGDSGPGIMAEVQDSVFEPFFTTKGVGEGSGLGLSQVYGFAAQSGGTATIGTSPLGGAAVSMYLPVIEGT